MSVNLPHKFPNRVDEIRRRALEFRRLSTDDRFQRLFDLIAFGQTLMEHSPKREIARQLREKSEADWRRAYKELFTRHGYIASEPATGPDDGTQRTDAGA